VVPSFGIPGNDVNLGYVLTLPPSVNKCFHAMALDERRGTFKVQRVVTTMNDATALGRVYEVWFRRVHSDVGGGNRNIGLSSIALHWMYKRAKSCGVPIPDSEIQRQAANMNPAAAISENRDPIKDPYRPIPWTDVVHHSVTYREGAYNPPQGLQIVDDDGKHPADTVPLSTMSSPIVCWSKCLVLLGIVTLLGTRDECRPPRSTPNCIGCKSDVYKSGGRLSAEQHNVMGHDNFSFERFGSNCQLRSKRPLWRKERKVKIA
jgi:uncharacterized protein (DUF2235 family)